MQFDENQQNALNRLKSGSILVGGVGSGKSRTALAYYFCKECKGSMEVNYSGEWSRMRYPKDLYIITTAAKRDKLEWDKELYSFNLFRNEPEKGINPEVKIVVDSWNNINKYTNVCGAFFIFDEQRVVGTGVWSKSFIQITKKNRWILLSATPGDKWEDYISVFIANGFYKNKTEFVRRHLVFSKFTNYPKVERYLEVERLEKLRSLVLIDMKVVRETKKHKSIISVSYDKENYDLVIRDRWNIFEDEPIENISSFSSVLRKIVNSDNDRIVQVKELIRANPRTIIFYNFDYELEILREVGKELEIYTAEWNGHKHMPVPDYDNWVYLVQYNAGAEGWECTTTNVIIFYSLNYSYRMMIQAAGRIDRRNTPYKDLYYYYLKSRSSIDNAIMRSLENKKDFNERKFYEKETS